METETKNQICKEKEVTKSKSNSIRKRKRRKKKSKIKLFETFTKLWVSILLVIAVVDLQLSYVLAYIGRDEIAETLSVAIVTEIIGVISVYMIRAFFDTASEKKLDYDYKKNGLSTNDYPVGVEDDNEEGIEGEFNNAVG